MRVPFRLALFALLGILSVEGRRRLAVDSTSTKRSVQVEGGITLAAESTTSALKLAASRQGKHVNKLGVTSGAEGLEGRREEIQQGPDGAKVQNVETRAAQVTGATSQGDKEEPSRWEALINGDGPEKWYLLGGAVAVAAVLILLIYAVYQRMHHLRQVAPEPPKTSRKKPLEHVEAPTNSLAMGRGERSEGRILVREESKLDGKTPRPDIFTLQDIDLASPIKSTRFITSPRGV